MTTVRRVAELRETVGRWRRAGAKIGLVPTMGALHAGHMALVAAARRDCDRVIATLFVNPKQFDEAADLAGYPADPEADARRLAEAGVDLLFAPAVAEMYPEGFSTAVSVGGLTDCLCGRARPGHFAGVATVVAKLFIQAQADVAYFGEKDYQQLLVVRRLARDLDLPLGIEAVPTVRAPDGLALSSRNRSLSAAERRIAPALHRVLGDLTLSLADGRAAAPALARGRGALEAAGFARIDYLELRDGASLAALERARPPARLFGAAWLGAVRLIDNLPVA